MSLFEYVGQQIKALRTSWGGGKGLSQEQLGEELGVATNTISRWETATYQPDLKDLEKISRFFGVSILRFFPPQEAAEPKVQALLRATEGLDERDMEELQRYAEFRKARNFMDQNKRPVRGRKRKAEE